MKTEILRILQMQADGKLTQDQAAEILAILAGQAREKPSVSTPLGIGAPGPQGGDACGCGENEGTGAGEARRSAERGPSFTQSATRAVQTLMDTAVGMGSTVSRAATVLGGEFMNMVHREQSGNTITLSKVDEPTGDNYQFKANTFNVSRLSEVVLHGAQFSNNSVNASRVSQVNVSRGQFSQCLVTGSSISHVTVEGIAAVMLKAGETGATGVGAAMGGSAAVRGVTFNATKFARVKATGGSQIDACTFVGSAVKDVELGGGSVLRDSSFNDATIGSWRLERATVTKLAVERSQAQGLTINGATVSNAGLHSTRWSESAITGGTWNNVQFRRNAAGGGMEGGAGGRDSLVHETTFENCTMTDCSFIGCTFRRTTLRGLTLSGVTVRNVDFTGMTLETEEAFRRAAGV